MLPFGHINSQSHNTKQREPASRENGKKVMQIFPTRMSNITAWRHSILRAHCPSRGGAEGEVFLFRSPGIAASPISFVYRMSLWAVLNGGGKNSPHLKANMLPLFSIMTLCINWLHICFNRFKPFLKNVTSFVFRGGRDNVIFFAFSAAFFLQFFLLICPFVLVATFTFAG